MKARVAPERSRAARSAVRGARMNADCELVVYPHASHWLFVTHREGLNDQLTAFARDRQARPGHVTPCDPRCAR